MSQTTKNSWKAITLKAEQIATKIKNKEITIPDFQRSLVWNDEAKGDFIDTLKKGFPFGSLLFYKQTDGKYRILDGFQRSSTINEFINNPSKYFSFDEKYVNKLKGLLIPFNLERDSIVEDIVSMITQWVEENHPTMTDVKDMQYNECIPYLSVKYPILISPSYTEPLKELLDLLKISLREFKDLCEELSGYELSVLEVEGPEEFLPLIFERINNKGTKLTKYDIYNASWTSPDDKITIIEEEKANYKSIIDYVIQRKDVILDEGYLIEDFSSEDLKRTRALSFYDFLFGYGRLLAERYPYLFGENGAADKVNSSSFNLITACLGLKNSEMNRVNKVFRDRFKTDIEKFKFVSSVETAVKFVDNHVTNKLYSFKANKSSKKSRISFAHSEFQILSLIAAVFFVMFNEQGNDGIFDIPNDSLQKTKTWKKHESNFKKYLLIHYCQIVFRKDYAGSGDSKLDGVIKNPLKFSEPVSWESFERVLLSWIDERNTSRSERTSVKKPTVSEDLFLRLVYRLKFTAADQTDFKTFDVEHIATKAQMIKQIQQFEDLRLPIGTIGNLCYLPSKYNRSKQDKTIYQDFQYREQMSEAEFKIIEQKFTLTEEKDLRFLDENKTLEEFKSAYYNYLDKRVRKMLEILKSAYFETI